VVEGRVAFSFGQTLIESFNRDVLRNGPGFCGATDVCSSASSGSLVTNPPPFNASLVPLTPVSWRRIYRRTVDDLTFPLTFSAANDVGSACGPMCAENISESIPSFNLTPPAFTCDEFLPVNDGCSGCWDESHQKNTCDANGATVGDCITDCPGLGSGLPGGGSINTIEDNSTTGIVGSGFPLDPRVVRIPDSFTVTLS